MRRSGIVFLMLTAGWASSSCALVAGLNDFEESGGSKSGVETVPSTFALDGLGAVGEWQGYLYPTTDDLGSTISPTSFSASGSELCVSGTVQPQSDWSGYARVRWLLFQDVDAGSSPGEMRARAPGGRGVAYEVVNNSEAALRLDLDSSPSSNGSPFYCAYLEGEAGELSWGSFETECWMPSGQGTYDGLMPIHSISVVVGGNDQFPVDFDFCIKSLTPLF